VFLSRNRAVVTPQKLTVVLLRQAVLFQGLFDSGPEQKGRTTERIPENPGPSPLRLILIPEKSASQLQVPSLLQPLSGRKPLHCYVGREVVALYLENTFISLSP
jgi:hypothetical protein